jgi:VanZ family protein
METATSPSLSFQRQPEFLKLLGLAFPCSEADVQQAFRQKVWQAHPDRGGDMQGFIALQQAFEQALEYIRFQGGRRHWLAQSLERYVEQQAAIAEIEEAGGRVEIESVNWFSDEFGDDFAHVLERVVGIELSGPKFDDAVVASLLNRQPLRAHLHRLNLSGSAITSRALTRLGRLAKLRELDLSNTRIGNRALSAVNHLPELEKIDLSGTRVGLIGRLALAWSRPYLLVRQNGRGYSPTFGLLRRVLAMMIGVYLTLMFVATHIKFRNVHLPHEELPIDKVIHFGMYLVLGFLARAAVGLSRRASNHRGAVRWMHILLLVILFGWALLDELTQPMFGRTFEWFDWLSDILGILAGVACFQLLLNVIRRRMPTVWVVSKSQHDVAEHRRKLRETIEGLAVHSI